MNLYQISNLIPPLLSACVAGCLSYFFAKRSKKLDILYQHKVPAFKEIASKLIGYRAYCLGRITHLTANTVSPYYNDQLAAVHYHAEVAKAVDINVIFLSKTDKQLIDNLLNKMEGISTMEIDFGQDPMMVNWLKQTVEEIDTTIDVLYKDLNLKH